MESFVGKVDSIFFRNEDNGYTVAKFITDDKEEIVCNGVFITIDENDYLELQGEMVIHQKFGLQLNVSSYFIPKLMTKESIVAFLGSGVIHGMREKTAKKIVDHFGLGTMEILENNPGRLEEVSGIGGSTLKKIIEGYNSKREEKNIIMGLAYYNISPSVAMKIFAVYGLNTLKKIKENPYGLCKDVVGIGFKKADEIAEKLGVGKNSLFRIEEGLVYVLSESAAQGHTYLPYSELVIKSKEILETGEESVAEALYEQCVKGYLKIEDVGDERRVFLQNLYLCECNIASKLMDLLREKTEISENKWVSNVIKNAEDFLDIKLADKQREAVELALSSKLMILTGGPGTGKTTVVRFIIECFREAGKKVVLCAPTGRAAKRLSESGGLEAQTVHRLLEVGYGDDTMETSFGRDEFNPIDAQVIIMDECSMVDVYLMRAFLRAVDKKATLVFIGDCDQLPSVGAGNVLDDMIESKVISTVTLDEIFRQSQESDIIANAHRVNKGEQLVVKKDAEDFFFMERFSAKQSSDLIEELVSQRLPKYFDLSVMDIQVLSPVRKGEIGILSLNSKLQQKINPPREYIEEISFGDKLFRTGDKVMQIKNEYDRAFINNNTFKKGEGIFNGDIGYVDAIDKKNRLLYVSFDDGRRVEYAQGDLDNLELAYAITVHKSQGCEFPVVVLPIINIPPNLQSRNILYTAMTRAKKAIVIVGSKNMVDLMISREIRQKRYSSLSERIIDIGEIWEE